MRQASSFNRRFWLMRICSSSSGFSCFAASNSSFVCESKPGWASTRLTNSLLGGVGVTAGALAFEEQVDRGLVELLHRKGRGRPIPFNFPHQVSQGVADLEKRGVGVRLGFRRRI